VTRRLLVAGLLVLAAALIAPPAGATPAADATPDASVMEVPVVDEVGGDDDGGEATTTTLAEGGSTGDIIPRPGSGTPPEEAGDRGGAGQVGVFVAVCVALAVIFGLALRQARRAQARRGPRTGT
jgi:hypothetical protein